MGLPIQIKIFFLQSKIFCCHWFTWKMIIKYSNFKWKRNMQNNTIISFINMWSLYTDRNLKILFLLYIYIFFKFQTIYCYGKSGIYMFTANITVLFTQILSWGTVSYFTFQNSASKTSTIYVETYYPHCVFHLHTLIDYIYCCFLLSTSVLWPISSSCMTSDSVFHTTLGAELQSTC